ncbi:MAG: hemolysin III family protein [Oleispira sp.]|nr:hemolysin III family protein [Oleispira sp.]
MSSPSITPPSPSRFRDPFSGFSHLLGALTGLAVLCFLVIQASLHGDIWQITSFAVFGICMMLMFGSSALYHLAQGSDDTILKLKRIDHMAIFAMIAGTYTPICLVSLRDSFGWILLIIVWSLALAGILLKIFWIAAPRWLSTLIYLAMGWACVFGLSTMQQVMPTASFDWLFYGGIAYTIGAVIYATKWPDPWPKSFGFHEIWHLFVLAGAFSHAVAVYYLL